MVPADVAWMLVATALVLLMTPALAFFYGGLVRSKNALNTMMMSFISLGFVAVVWALLGYSLAFAPGSSILGGFDHALLQNVGLEAKGTIPHVLFMAYQATFAIITAALISGAIVERMGFNAYVTFITLWALAVYSPVAHWVWGGGWLATMGALDFAGGTVVHVNAARGGAGRGRGDRPAQGLHAPGVPAAQRAVHAARRRHALVRLVRLQRRQRALGRQFRGARLRHHDARPGGHAGGLVADRHVAQRPRHRGRRGHGDRRRPGRDHAGGRLRQPAQRAGARRHRGGPELLRAGLARPHASRRLARRGRGARRGRRGRRAPDRRVRAEKLEHAGGRRAVRQPAIRW